MIKHPEAMAAVAAASTVYQTVRDIESSNNDRRNWSTASTVLSSSNPYVVVPRVEILSDWKSLSAALLDDAAVEARSDASTSNLLLLLKDAAHKAVGGQLVPSRQEAR